MKSRERKEFTACPDNIAFPAKVDQVEKTREKAYETERSRKLLSTVYEKRKQTVSEPRELFRIQLNPQHLLPPEK